MRNALLAVLILAAVAAQFPSFGADYYVATNGDDANPGTRESPLATLERARDAIRSLPSLPPGGVTVWIRGGDYFRAAAFVLDKRDSGSEESPIVYRACEGEEVRMVGGRALDPKWFSPATPDTPGWNRLPEESRAQAVVANLAEHGIRDYGKMCPRGDGFRSPRPPAPLELFVDDAPMTLARWPNEGFARTRAVKESPAGSRIGFPDSRCARWSAARDVCLAGYWRYSYVYDCVPVSSIDAAAETISLFPGPPSGIAENRPFLALNVLEELDAPGEWYLERPSGTLYLWPPKPLDSSRIVVSVLEDYLLHLVDASYVSVEGMTFETSRGWGVMIYGGAHCRLTRCIVRNVGQAGVHLSGGSDNRVEDCHIYGCGEDGVFVQAGDRKSLTACKNAVSRNRIHHCARLCRANRPAVRLDGVGAVVSHNSIHDMPHYGIWYMGNDHTIEFNEIYRVCAETADTGAIYCGFGWDKRGTTIRSNLIRDVRTALEPKGQTHGVYLDDCGCGDTVEGNVLRDVDGSGVFIGGGRDNRVLNNVIVRCASAIHIDDRGLRMVNERAGDAWNLLEKIQGFDYRNPPWSERYPALVRILDEGIEEAKKPRGNVVERNSSYENGQWVHDGMAGLGATRYLLQKDNLAGVDPLFVDPSRPEKGLKEGSPALSIPGFAPVRGDAMGP